MGPEWQRWEPLFKDVLGGGAGAPDSAHDIAHVERVVANAKALARSEGANLAVVVPAAWLHDYVSLPKDSPQRASASSQSAQRASALLEAIGYPAELLPQIYHAIEAHSFSAGIVPRTPEAQVVQDADRLDALGAIGIARCFVTGGALGRRLYHPDEPLPQQRVPDDRDNSVDHFYCKLLRLAEQMQTQAGRQEAERRTSFLRDYLAQLEGELHFGQDDEQKGEPGA